MARPTPCGSWLVRDLLAHQLGQDLAFSAALRGGATTTPEWASVTVGSDVPAPLMEALTDQQHALEEFGASGRTTIWMPEIIADRPLPAERALAAHLIDLLIHSWDLGVSVDTAPTIDDDLAEFCRRLAETIPDTPERRAPGSAFGRAEPVIDDEPPFDRALRLLGRDPGWSAPRSHATL